MVPVSRCCVRSEPGASARPPQQKIASRFLRKTGTGSAGALLSEILPSARVARFVRMTQKIRTAQFHRMETAAGCQIGVRDGVRRYCGLSRTLQLADALPEPVPLGRAVGIHLDDHFVASPSAQRQIHREWIVLSICDLLVDDEVHRREVLDAHNSRRIDVAKILTRARLYRTAQRIGRVRRDAKIGQELRKTLVLSHAQRIRPETQREVRGGLRRFDRGNTGTIGRRGLRGRRRPRYIDVGIAQADAVGE